MPFTQCLDWPCQRARSLNNGYVKRKRNTEQESGTSRPIVLSVEEVRRLRLRAQRLHPQAESGTSAAEVVRTVCGVQAQAAAAARLSVRARSRGLTDGDVER